MIKDRFPEHLKKIRDDYTRVYKKEHRVAKGRMLAVSQAINSLYEFMLTKNITGLNSLNISLMTQYQYYIYRFRLASRHCVYRYMKDLEFFFNRLFFEEQIKTNPIAQCKFVEPPKENIWHVRRYYSVQELRNKWANYIKHHHNSSVHTYKSKILGFDVFIQYLQEQGIKSVYKVKQEHIEGFKEYLKGYITVYGKVFNNDTQIRYLRSVYQFFMFMWKNRLITQNPVLYLNLKKYLRELDRINPVKADRKTVKYPEFSPELRDAFSKFSEYFLSGGGSAGVIKNYHNSLKKLWEYLTIKNITRLAHVTKPVLMDFQAYIFNLISPVTGRKYSPSTLQNMMVAVRSFFKFLVKYDILKCDPSSALDLPKAGTGLPHTCMTEREVKIILEQPDIHAPIGLRDRAIMELLYSTGIRSTELAGIKVSHMNLTDGLLRVEQAKGGSAYQRIVPAGKTACYFIREYLSKVRPYIVNHMSKDYLFLSPAGRSLCRSRVLAIVKRYLYKSGLRKNICTHSFRVSCATHMLKNDADIRYVQEQLGHKSIRTTQGYTRIVPKDLKEIHRRCHPREKFTIEPRF